MKTTHNLCNDVMHITTVLQNWTDSATKLGTERPTSTNVLKRSLVSDFAMCFPLSASLLATNMDISELIMRGCTFDTHGMDHLAQCLKELSSLKVLDLSQNKIGSLGAMHLGTVRWPGVRFHSLASYKPMGYMSSRKWISIHPCGMCTSLVWQLARTSTDDTNWKHSQSFNWHC